MADQPNFTPLGDGFYLVRTQAGFEQALKHRFENTSGADVEGFPKSYPSIVSINWAYRFYHYINVNTIHVNALKNAIKEA